MIGKTNLSGNKVKINNVKVVKKTELIYGGEKINRYYDNYALLPNDNPALPYSFYNGSAVVYDNELHILGGSDSQTSHYKLNGSKWTSVSTLPYSFYGGGAVVYNNEIHILGGDGNKTGHYKWDASSWTSVSTLPYNFFYDGAVVFWLAALAAGVLLGAGEVCLIMKERNKREGAFLWN